MTIITQDISPEDVSQELDNVIQSYDTNEAAYTHDKAAYAHDAAQGSDSYDHRQGVAKTNGTNVDLGKEDHYKAKRKRKRDSQNDGKNSAGYMKVMKVIHGESPLEMHRKRRLSPMGKIKEF